MLAGPRHVCPACGTAADEFGPGPDGRTGRSCCACRGLERHRFLALLLEALAPAALAGGGAVLEVGPVATTARRLRELAAGRYVALDLDPAADRRSVDLRASMTHLPLPDRSVGLMVCYHVLEHVPDDGAAMTEIARVLRPDGVAVVQVPYRPGATDEDPHAPADERARRFGQADHVRYYGDDVDDRLRRAGLTVQRVRPVDVTAPAMIELFKLPATDLVWLCRRQDGDPGPTVSDLASSWGQVLPVVMRRMAQRAAEAPREQADERLVQALAEVEHWRTSYRLLRGRLPVRALLVVARARKRLLRLIGERARRSVG